MISNLYLFAAALFCAGFSTGILPGLFLAVLVEAKYHRVAKFVEFLNRVSEDGLEAEQGLVIFYGASPELAALG
jgi:hypothetical protein